MSENTTVGLSHEAGMNYGREMASSSSERSFVSNNVLSAIGAITGLIGTSLLSFSTSLVFVTFLLYAVSNVAWIWFGQRLRDGRWVLVMNVGYMLFTVNGLIHHWP